MISRPWNTNVLKKIWVSPEMDIVERFPETVVPLNHPQHILGFSMIFHFG